ncbi:predicted protein [Histoplasma mississippiense (nom. inval.)]|uniref:predicted protein n=1 Tax=Ajellomyces capsulatus (strain NAm1 / WU24) TaxID=2059318 RepID=UPI000157CA89|nr:predicted protein [Histoplasma mississippiense (nom. inval.)]XP_001539320.1 predicted protein [Histoplasma mississippiense (nom. inval.)]EDN09758.1 predicted protein [Histoplasma mississippiense (nom. inval.)]EDN11258.1 predicted protein [Histoplasma mississippiense (nom. inval.)]
MPPQLSEFTINEIVRLLNDGYMPAQIARTIECFWPLYIESNEIFAALKLLEVLIQHGVLNLWPVNATKNFELNGVFKLLSINLINLSF